MSACIRMYIVAEIVLLTEFTVDYNYTCTEDTEEPVDLELPNQWLWDIIDEFLYQVQVILYIICTEC